MLYTINELGATKTIIILREVYNALDNKSPFQYEYIMCSYKSIQI